MVQTSRAIPATVLASAFLVIGMIPGPLAAQKPVSKPEEIEWTWEVRPARVDGKLPNVLLVGDSISRNYYPEVKRQLDGVSNVYLLATSTAVGDPRLTYELKEFAAMEAVTFKVVHFNNGMHGWDYSEEEYKAAFPAFLKALRRIAPHASFIWASTTPVKVDVLPGPTNARINARNRIALALTSEVQITLDDQHELMMHHSGQFEDKVHFNSQGATIEGQQAAEQIRSILALLRTGQGIHWTQHDR
jgi:hypothetical protein